ncbi:hypothetical protein LZ518_04585 [Sphingomonas sp. RB56-2]|uniref:Uncharacterized protein n=1 Tax=Sphingomonas brevis TaxID=2908206 RepID=A0ABT0S8H2_9SPHN|nr:hypothetical protein [Sphingomonas brevis]MCL6740406.1 hypothetical protein [Sphingomonas brevis]
MSHGLVGAAATGTAAGEGEAPIAAVGTAHSDMAIAAAVILRPNADINLLPLEDRSINPAEINTPPPNVVLLGSLRKLTQISAIFCRRDEYVAVFQRGKCEILTFDCRSAAADIRPPLAMPPKLIER